MIKRGASVLACAAMLAALPRPSSGVGQAEGLAAVSQRTFDATGILKPREAATRSGLAVAEPAAHPRPRPGRRTLPTTESNPYARQCLSDFIEAGFDGPDIYVLGCRSIRGPLALKGVETMIQYYPACGATRPCVQISAGLIAALSEIKNEQALKGIESLFSHGYYYRDPNSGEPIPETMILAIGRVRSENAAKAVSALFTRDLTVDAETVAAAARAATDGQSDCVQALVEKAPEISADLIHEYCLQ